uniref:Carboxylic ester hydrolase n=1 Tax=Culex quinquefasciatus TaxID=7176 RepID=A0A904MV96_CULQU
MWWSTREYLVIILKLALSFVSHGIGNVLIRFWPGFERPVVEVRQGKVRGVTSELPNGRKYHYFKGIPYAKPPVGELRFRPPVPLEKFNQPELNCSSDKGDFVQPHIVLNWPVVGSEDGLYLNVYTPGLPTEENAAKYPVMVYIHGGGLRFGTASSFIYDPKHIVQRNVIVVTMFYRLGPLGFLCLPSVGINGNMGLKDQRLALQWVQENIAKFGGDADNVTLFGESAGSWSTYLHYLSPNSRKYFHRVICQSGDACTESSFQIDPEGKARKLAQLLGCWGSSDQEVLDTLMKAPARTLAKLQNDVITPEEKSCAMRFIFRPVIEQKLTEDSIITQTPEQLLKSFDTLQMPMMSGVTSAEGVLALNLNKYCLEKFSKYAEDWLVPRFMSSPEGLDRRAIVEEVKRFYLGDKDVCWATINESCALLSDFTFVGTSNLSAEWIAKYQPNVRHYHYLFNFVGRMNIMKPLFNVGAVDGASHGDDNFYLFSPKVLPELSDASDEAKMRNIFIDVFTNFAKFNDPTTDESTLGFKWTPIASTQRDSESFDIDCLELNVPPRMVRNPSQERKEFWRAMLKKHTNLL